MYTVTKLAELLGVGADVVRHYTDCGLLKPWVNPENGYRFYNEEDMVKVLYARVCRSFGLTVAGTIEFGKGTVEEQISYLERQKEDIDRQLWQLRLMKGRIREVGGYIGRSGLCTGQVTSVVRSGIHSIYVIGGEKDHSAQKKLISQWVDKLPYTHISIKVPLDELSDPNFSGCYSVEVGMGVIHRYLKDLGLPAEPPVESIPGGEHLIIYLKCKNIFSLSPVELAPLFNYAREHKLRFLHNTSGRVLSVVEGEEGPLYSIMLRVRVGPD